MKEKIEHLKRIAKANDDVFKFYITITGYKNLEYTLCVEEEEEGHQFLIVCSDDLNSLEKEVTPMILKECCKFWSYKYVD